MALINHRAREVHCKIVYYGPGLGGKTTNVKVLYQRLPQDRRGRLVSIATEQERTLFFDFMPVELGTVNGFITRFHLYTVPGQLYYRRSRRAVLQGVDGVVFVADSQPDRERDNLDSLEDMTSLLSNIGMTSAQIARLPRVVQYNKRDVPNALPIDRMRALLNPAGVPEFEAVAVEGRGVPETMRTIAKAVLGRLVAPSAAPPAASRASA
jgi:mutual gliding-motility protein MglA